LITQQKGKLIMNKLLTIPTEILQETLIALRTREIELCKALARPALPEALELILTRQLDRTSLAIKHVASAAGEPS
jgi:hypothetical protein